MLNTAWCLYHHRYMVHMYTFQELGNIINKAIQLARNKSPVTWSGKLIVDDYWKLLCGNNVLIVCHSGFCTQFRQWHQHHEIGRLMTWPILVWSDYKAVVIIVMMKTSGTTGQQSTLFVLFTEWPCGLNSWNETLLLYMVASVGELVQQSGCPCAPLLPLCMWCGQPLLPGGEDRAEPAGEGWQGVVGEGGRGVSWHCATFSWLPGLTGGKEGGCCVSDWWGQVCGPGIECCRTDVLLAYPALSASNPPPLALRTRLIGTPNCPYEYFRGEQEWEFRVGGMVSRALTANDPLNDQREREREREGV